MSAGKDLAETLWTQMDDDQRKYAERACPKAELEGFLIGTFWNKHSRVALYNAASEMYFFVTQDGKRIR